MKIESSKTKLKINFTLFEKIFSFHRDFLIEKKNVISIKRGKPPIFHPLSIRAPGTFILGLVRLGTYYNKRGREFWFWLRWKKYEYTIELRGERYDRLVVSTDKEIKGVL